MKTGFRGTFVVSWSQTELDGLQAAPVEAVTVGAAWSWRGDAVQVDGPTGVLRLDNADGEAELRRRAARSVRRLVGAALQDHNNSPGTRDRAQDRWADAPLADRCFVVTNGVHSYTATVIETNAGQPSLLMFVDELPPRETDLWVVRQMLTAPQSAAPQRGAGVICFTPGTMITTPTGPRAVETLREGDRVQTRDSGAQDILWIGSRRISGARLYVMPALRPVRIRAGALGIDRPDQQLLVSPEHRMLIQGRRVEALFNTPEVLVTAADLVNGQTVVTDTAVREVTYIHILLSSHQVLWANGVPTESFHPASASLEMLQDADRQRLLQLQPQLEEDPFAYGGFARRNLNRSEAAILARDAA